MNKNIDSIADFLLHPEAFSEEETQFFLEKVDSLTCSPKEWWAETPEENRLNNEMMQALHTA